MKKKQIFCWVLVSLFAIQMLLGCGDMNLPQPVELEQEMVINFIDVGQGDCIYIEFPTGETMLIDAGERENAKKIIDFIKTDGKDTLTYVVATHPHADHIGGMADVINEFDVKNIYMPRVSHTTVTFEKLLDTIANKGLSIDTAKAGKVLFASNNLRAEFLAPGKDAYNDLNNYSAVIMITYNNQKMLFMGDAESQIESELIGNDISADLLKIGHHGSHTSSTERFIQAVDPSYAIICAGKDNTYGHPSEATLATLTKYNVEIWRTDESGTMTFVCDGEKIIQKDAEKSD